MQTKSNIQIIAEALMAKNKFFGELYMIAEKYNIEDNVFCCGVNGVVEEPSTGYFGQVKECETLTDAAVDFNIFTQGIRIKENKIFVGNLYKELNQVQESTFVDLKNRTVINS